MNRQSIEKIAKCYNTTADIYAADRIDELTNKPFDRMLLKEFASVNQNKGPCGDVGCGPGHTTKFLFDHGLRDIVGIDLSPAMIDIAGKLFPDIRFKTGDILNLSYHEGHFACIMAYYAIVHFSYDQNREAFREINRVLKREGQFLLAFHVGDEAVHFDKVNDRDIDIDLHFFETDKILTLLSDTGFEIIDAIERQPYKGSEYESRRAYVWCKKVKECISRVSNST